MSDCLAVWRDPKAEISTARRESTDDIDATMADCSSMLASGIGSAFSWVELIEARLVVCLAESKKYCLPLGLAAGSPRSRWPGTCWS